MAVEVLLNHECNPNMIDFVPESDPSTPLDYANAVGAYLCADILLAAGALTAQELLSQSATQISRYWRGYTTRKHISFKSKSPADEIMHRKNTDTFSKNLMNLPKVMLDGDDSTQLFERMLPLQRMTSGTRSNRSRISVNSEEGPRIPAVRRVSLGGVLPIAPFGARRSSTASFLSYLTTASSQGMIQPISSAESEKDAAARKIQKVWRTRQRKIEAKFLIQLMGVEEAAKMLEKNFQKENSTSTPPITSNVPLGRPPSKEVPPSLGKQGRRGSAQGRGLFAFPARPPSIHSRRGSFIEPTSTVEKPLQEYISGFVDNILPAEINTKPDADLDFRSGFVKNSTPEQARMKRHANSKKNNAGAPQSRELVEHTATDTPKEARDSSSSSFRQPQSSNLIKTSVYSEESLTATEIEYFRNLAHEFRSGGLTDSARMDRGKTNKIKSTLVDKAIREEDESKVLSRKSSCEKRTTGLASRHATLEKRVPVELALIESADGKNLGASLSPFNKTQGLSGMTFSPEEMAYFAMEIERRREENES